MVREFPSKFTSGIGQIANERVPFLNDRQKTSFIWAPGR